MLYEIYELKSSLNVEDDSEEDEKLDEMIQVQKLCKSKIRPPTPPKILDENKVMEKLECYQNIAIKTITYDKKLLNNDKKTVTLVDTNHELFVTEEDVLLSLIENGIDPKVAQSICRNLLYRSRDIIPTTYAEEVK